MDSNLLNNFKDILKAWQSSNLDLYENFEMEMNKKDFSGYLRVFQFVLSAIPDYKDLVSRKLAKGAFDDVSDFERVFAEANVSLTIKSEFDQNLKTSIVPSMLCWLFLGKGYERMVEKGDELRTRNELAYHEKLFLDSVISNIIESSITSGIRSRGDWDKHFELMNLADIKTSLKWSSNSANGNRSPDLVNNEKGLNLSSDIIYKLEDFIKTKNSEYDLACLKIALEELSLTGTKNIKSFRDALQQYYGDRVIIIGARGIQNKYRDLTMLMEKGGFVKDLPDNRKVINNIKLILSE